MPGARWRKVLGREVKSVAVQPFRGAIDSLLDIWRPPPPPDALARVRHVANALERGRDRSWRGPGLVRLDGGKVLFEDERGVDRTSLSTITSAVREGVFVWVRRHRAHDWLLRFETDHEAAQAVKRMVGVSV